jgi:N-acyl homoserine lactone hydrolase
VRREVQVLPLRLAEVTYPASHPWHGRPGIVFGYALRSEGQVVLVDTGLGPAHREIDPYYHPVRTDLGSALLRRGIPSKAVSAIICTHLHFDHCGGNAAFPGVPIFVQSAEKEAARAEGYTIPEWIEFPGARYELRSGDFSLADGIEVLATPGHTPGHQSVLVQEEGGSVLLAGHAIASAREWSREEAPAETSRVAIRSADRLRGLNPRKVYFSHDETTFAVDVR